jgi:hypothetical protein
MDGATPGQVNKLKRVVKFLSQTREKRILKVKVHGKMKPWCLDLYLGDQKNKALCHYLAQ